MPPPARDKWEQYAESTGGADKWEQFAEPSSEDELTKKTQAAAPKTSTRPYFEKPPVGTPFPSTNPIEAHGERLDLLGQREERAKRSITPVTNATAVIAPAAAAWEIPGGKITGAITSGLGRVATGLTGAHYGGKTATELGLPKWTGQAVGGATGLLAPEVAAKMFSKMSGPLALKIASILGKSPAEVATVIAEDSTLANKVGRDVVERAARGEPLTPKEEELLFDQVQKHYTPEAGVESSAKKAGRIYAGRGTNLRPTNEQLAIAKRTGVPPPPEPTPVTTGGSGESGASAEAINRTAAEKRGGVKYFIEDTRTKSRVPVSSVDVNSGLRVGPGKRIIRSGPEGEFEF